MSLPNLTDLILPPGWSILLLVGHDTARKLRRIDGLEILVRLDEARTHYSTLTFMGDTFTEEEWSALWWLFELPTPFVPLREAAAKHGVSTELMALSGFGALTTARLAQVHTMIPCRVPIPDAQPAQDIARIAALEARIAALETHVEWLRRGAGEDV